MISPPLSRSDGSSQSNMWIVVAGKERERRARDCRARGRTRDGARVRRLRLGRTGCVVRRVRQASGRRASGLAACTTRARPARPERDCSCLCRPARTRPAPSPP